MGLNMAITELESDKALCKKKKMMLAKVYVDDISKWGSMVEVDRVVDVSKASKKLGRAKVDELLKKNRIEEPEDGKVFLEKIKDDSEKKLLMPFVEDVKTNWILMEKVPGAKKNEVLAAANKQNSVTEWDLVEFDDMYATCAKCGLSWDNKKGCVGNFGPSTSPVPDLAKKYGLTMLSKVNEYGEEKKVLTSKDAQQLLSEVKVLREKVPAEGKMMVRRIEGTLNRLEALAKCSKEYEVDFYFF
ncbi:hypothetical protein E2P63_09110 [Candidatus Bathyarchaeota archaeon]|nr:hypothetical protein E2P63_09110 [Candidatus Bathyarchaeota archaeon]